MKNPLKRGILFYLAICVVADCSLVANELHPAKESNPYVDAIHPRALNDGDMVLWRVEHWYVKSVANKNVFLKVILNIEFDNQTQYVVAFTRNNRSCNDVEVFFNVKYDDDGLPSVQDVFVESGIYHTCLGIRREEGIVLRHQGTGPFLTMDLQLSDSQLIEVPDWVKIILVVLCQLLAALLSGLNIGLLSLDVADLEVLANTGSFKEKYYAHAVLPIRKRGNFLLCSIVVTQALMNSLFTVLLDSMVGGLIATLAATLTITVFVEILPQAICSKYGLVIGAVTAPIMKLIMLVTGIFSWPAGKLMDKILKNQSPIVHSKDKIKVLIETHANDVDSSERQMISGMLNLKYKPVCDHITPIGEVFMIERDTVMTEHLFQAICESGYSRVPVYNTRREKVTGVLHVKDLAMLDRAHLRNAGSICDCFRLPFDRCTTLANMSELFGRLRSSPIHMVIVESDNHEAVGILTKEDLLEAMLDTDIMDEHDHNRDQKLKRRSKTNKRCAMEEITKLGVLQQIYAIEGLLLTPIQKTVMSRLLEKCYIEKLDSNHEEFYRRGTETDNFMLILTGSVTVEVGDEGIKLEAGPFTHFGVKAVAPDIPSQSFVATVTVYTNAPMTYIWIPRVDLSRARRISGFERSEGAENGHNIIKND